MSKTYTQVSAHALYLANDAAFDATELAALFDEIYQRYWKTFLKDRVKVLANFISFSQNEYIKTGAVAAREVLSMSLYASGSLDITATPRTPLRRDDFDAVCADSEAGLTPGVPVRFGLFKNHGDAYWRVAVFPACDAAYTYGAEVLPEYTTPTGSTALEGDDVDAFNVARLTAIEVMVRNGDDPADIQQVWAPLEQAIKDKFQYILERGRPNEHPRKEQV